MSIGEWRSAPSNNYHDLYGASDFTCIVNYYPHKAGSHTEGMSSALNALDI